MSRGIRKSLIMNNPKMRSMAVSLPTTSNAKASRVVQDITYTSVLRGVDGNEITIAYTGGATAGSEVVTVTGTAISIQIETGVSTATQVKAAFDGESDATDLATATITGTAGTAQVIAAAVALAGGTALAATGFDASQITSVTENAVGEYTLVFRYPFNVVTECMAFPTSKTAGVQAYVTAVDHDRVTVKAVDTTDGSTPADCNMDILIIGNDGRLTY